MMVMEMMVMLVMLGGFWVAITCDLDFCDDDVFFLRWVMDA